MCVSGCLLPTGMHLFQDGLQMVFCLAMPNCIRSAGISFLSDRCRHQADHIVLCIWLLCLGVVVLNDKDDSGNPGLKWKSVEVVAVLSRTQEVQAGFTGFCLLSLWAWLDAYFMA